MSMNRMAQIVGVAGVMGLALGLNACAGPGVEFHVSVTGLDDAPGTAAQPFLTPARAQQAVRSAVTAAPPAAAVRVVVHGGTYWLPQGLTFDPGDTGGGTCRVTWAAAQGETARWVGGIRLTDGQKVRGEILSYALPDGVSPEQVFENGKRLTLARSPDEGYFTVDQPAGDGRNLFTYKAGDIEPAAWDLSTGARVFIWPGYDWFSHDAPLRSIDPASRLVTLASGGVYEIRHGNRYFVQNVPELLDRPGECVIDLKNRRVLVWPRDPANTAASELVVSTAKPLIELAGSKEAPVRNLHFEGLDFSIADGDVLRFSDAIDCSVRDCLIEKGGADGVGLHGRSQRIELTGCLIREHGADGVKLSGPKPSQPEGNFEHRIENNHIHHAGRRVGHGCGISITQSGRNRIANNLIHHMPRYGLSIKGQPYNILKQQMPGVTLETRHDVIHSRNNLIIGNDIHHVNEDSQDTGAIESWGPGRDNVIDGNLIHDSGNPQFDLQSGIYLDDASDYFTVRNNIIYGISGTQGNQPIYAKGIGNVISNNVLVAGPANIAAIRSFFMAEERSDHHVYVYNIVLLDDPYAGIYDFVNWSDDRVSESDFNVFWKGGAPLEMKGQSPARAFDDWRAWDGGRFDGHSVVADPMFVDAAKRDYRLHPDSPALKLGFRPIDVSTIGLRKDFPARFGQSGPDN